MHISAIDAPSDIYGEVTDVSRPLIYKLNQARMSATTYNALKALLAFAQSALDGSVKADLDEHLAHEGLPTHEEATAAETRPSESTQDAQTQAPEGKTMPEGEKPAEDAGNHLAEETTPLTEEMLGDTAEDLAAEAEVAQAIAAEAAKEEATVAEVPAKPATRVAKPK